MKGEKTDFCFLWVKVTPKAHRSEIVGWEENYLKVRLKAVPEKGAANAELIRLLADFLSMSRECVQLVSGETSRKKKLRLSGCSLEIVKQKISK